MCRRCVVRKGQVRFQGVFHEYWIAVGSEGTAPLNLHVCRCSAVKKIVKMCKLVKRKMSNLYDSLRNDHVFGRKGDSFPYLMFYPVFSLSYC